MCPTLNDRDEPCRRDGRCRFVPGALDPRRDRAGWVTSEHARRIHRRSSTSAFAGFDPARVARFSATRIGRLLQNPGIVRNRLKIESAVGNARAFIGVQEEYSSFDRYVWQFVGGRPRRNRWRRMGQVPARTAESDAMSKDLRTRGFRFVGSTLCYAFMQAVGMVNDHLVTCFRHEELSK